MAPGSHEVGTRLVVDVVANVTLRASGEAGPVPRVRHPLRSVNPGGGAHPVGPLSVAGGSGRPSSATGAIGGELQDH